MVMNTCTCNIFLLKLSVRNSVYFKIYNIWLFHPCLLSSKDIYIKQRTQEILSKLDINSFPIIKYFLTSLRSSTKVFKKYNSWELHYPNRTWTAFAQQLSFHFLPSYMYAAKFIIFKNGISKWTIGHKRKGYILWSPRSMYLTNRYISNGLNFICL